jgi:hypothetical protein
LFATAIDVASHVDGSGDFEAEPKKDRFEAGCRPRRAVMIPFVFSLLLVLVGISIALVVTFLSRKGTPRVSKINEVNGGGWRQ